MRLPVSGTHRFSPLYPVAGIVMPCAARPGSPLMAVPAVVPDRGNGLQASRASGLAISQRIRPITGNSRMTTIPSTLPPVVAPPCKFLMIAQMSRT
jgi:hypothetical protein